MEQQCAQSNQLCVVLKHEQTAKDNLDRGCRLRHHAVALLAQESVATCLSCSGVWRPGGTAHAELSEALQHGAIWPGEAEPAASGGLRTRRCCRSAAGPGGHVRELEVALEAAQRLRPWRLRRPRAPRGGGAGTGGKCEAPKTPPETLPGTGEAGVGPGTGRGRMHAGREDGSGAERPAERTAAVEQVAERQRRRW